MKSLKRFKIAMICSIGGLFLALLLIAGANSAKAGKMYYGEVVGIQDNLITIKLEDMPDLEIGARIEINPDVNIGNNPDPVVTPTAIPLCGADC